MRTLDSISMSGASATAWRPGTADVAPTSGTYTTGDFVVSLTGKLWVCTSGGTPGTWKQIGNVLVENPSSPGSYGVGTLYVGETDPAIGGSVPYVWLDPSELGISNVAPWLIDIDVFTPPSSQTNWSGLFYAAVLYSGGKWTNTQNGEISWNVVLGTGTWAIDLYAYTDPSYGIVTVTIDGASVGTLDLYSTSSAVPNNLFSITGVNIAATGKKLLKFKMLTKNPSSSAYGATIQHVRLRRTA